MTVANAEGCADISIDDETSRALLVDNVSIWECFGVARQSLGGGSKAASLPRMAALRAPRPNDPSGDWNGYVLSG